MLLYADDLIILAHSPIDLKLKVRALESYCRQSGLTVNIGKTKIVVFRRGRRVSEDVKRIKYMGQTLEVVSSYTYLGVPFSSSGLGLLAANTAAGRARAASGSTLALLARIKADAWKGMLRLHKSLVSSTLLYCAHIFGLRYSSTLNAASLSFFKGLFGLAPCTPGYVVRLELGLYAVELDLVKATIDWIIRMLKMEDIRIPKICFIKLVQLAKTGLHPAQYNWVTQVRQMLGDLDRDVLWDRLE